MEKSEGYSQSLKILGVGYWIPLLIISIVTTVTDDQKWGFLAFILVLLVVCGISYKVASNGNITLQEWYERILMCGVRRIAYSCS
jgi:hypothetical protein